MTVESLTLLSRRRFLALGLGAACCCLLPRPLRAGTPNWYEANREKLLAEFRDTNAGMMALARPRLGGKSADDAAREAEAGFSRLLPGLPDVGGEANRNLPFLVQAAWLVALYRPLAARGLSADEVGKMYFDLCAQSLAQAPAQAMLARGAAAFTPEALAATRAWALETQKRRYPADWVASYVEGDGATFDYGYDYVECGALKYFRAQGAADVAPWYCRNDFTISKIMGTGLFRTGTLADGAPRCDFRYRRLRRFIEQPRGSRLPASL